MKQLISLLVSTILVSACGSLTQPLQNTETPTLSEDVSGTTVPDEPLFVTPTLEAPTSENLTTTSEVCKNDYFPVSKGGRWVYRYTSSASTAEPLYLHVEIVEVLPEGFQSVILASPTTELEITANPQEMPVYQGTCSADGMISLYGDRVQDMSAGFFPVPREIPVDLTWKMYSTNSPAVLFTSLGTETVTVPYGTFESVKIEGNLTSVAGGFAWEWYAKGIGRIKHQKEIGNITITIELISFSMEK